MQKYRKFGIVKGKIRKKRYFQNYLSNFALETKRERNKIMALAIRPIPVLTGADAERFIEAAEAAEENPHTVDLEISQEDFEKMMAKAILA